MLILCKIKNNSRITQYLSNLRIDLKIQGRLVIPFADEIKDLTINSIK